MGKEISILLYSKTPSGGLKVLFRIGNGLLQRGHQVKFYIAEDQACYALEYENACELIHSEKLVPYRLFSRLKHLMQLEIKADIVMATYFPTAIAAYYNVKIEGQLFYYVQANETHFFSFRIKTLIRRFHYFLLAHLSYKLPISKVINCFGSSLGLPKAQYPEVPPGIDPSIYYPRVRSNRRLKIGHISRQEIRKGSAEFFTAMKNLRAQGFEFDLLIAYNKCTHTQGLEFEVQMPKNENELAAFYASCDIVLSTVWEKGFAYPPLETMACGSLCIATPIDYGTPSVDFVPIEINNAKGIEEAVKWVIHHPEEAEKIRLNGINLSQHYHWDKIIDKWERLFLC